MSSRSGNNVQQQSQDEKSIDKKTAIELCPLHKEPSKKSTSLRTEKAKRGKHFLKYRFLYGENVEQMENPGFLLEEIASLPRGVEEEDTAVAKWKKELAFWLWEQIKGGCSPSHLHTIEIDGTLEAMIRVSKKFINEEEQFTGIAKSDSGTQLRLDDLEYHDNSNDISWWTSGQEIYPDKQINMHTDPKPKAKVWSF
mgnify:CR=1 FL=1